MKKVALLALALMAAMPATTQAGDILYCRDGMFKQGLEDNMESALAELEIAGEHVVTRYIAQWVECDIALGGLTDTDVPPMAWDLVIIAIDFNSAVSLPGLIPYVQGGGKAILHDWGGYSDKGVKNVWDMDGNHLERMDLFGVEPMERPFDSIVGVEIYDPDMLAGGVPPVIMMEAWEYEFVGFEPMDGMPQGIFVPPFRQGNGEFYGLGAIYRGNFDKTIYNGFPTVANYLNHPGERWDPNLIQLFKNQIDMLIRQQCSFDVDCPSYECQVGWCDLAAGGVCRLANVAEGEFCNDGDMCNGVVDTCDDIGGCTVTTGNPCGDDTITICAECTNTPATPPYTGYSCTAVTTQCHDLSEAHLTGNCEDAQCDGSGNCVQDYAWEADDLDCLDTDAPGHEDCYRAACSSGVCVQDYGPEDSGYPCTDGSWCNGLDDDCDGSTSGPSPVPGCNNHDFVAPTDQCSTSEDSCNDECHDREFDVGDCYVDSGVECDDDEDPNPLNCYDAECDGNGNCYDGLAKEEWGWVCDDGEFCNGDDTCGEAIPDDPTSWGCTYHNGDPCVEAPVADCDNVCDEINDTCNLPAGTVCQSAEIPDDCYQAQCNGVGACIWDWYQWAAGTSCDDSQFCTDVDTCNAGGVCNGPGTDPGDPCPGPDGDDDCSEGCNEQANNCTAWDVNGSGCNDGLWCNGTDTCNDGQCDVNSGDPCVGGPECDNVCDEDNDTCNLPEDTPCGDDNEDDCYYAACETGYCDQFYGPEAQGESCDDMLFCTGEDTCDGTNNGPNEGCNQHTGDPCDPEAECDNNCHELGEGSGSCAVPYDTECEDLNLEDCWWTRCDGEGECDQQHTPRPEGVVCQDGLFCTGSDSCDLVGGCTVHTGDPCPGADGDGNCAESCDDESDTCDAPDENGSDCIDGQFCSVADHCMDGVCASAADMDCTHLDSDCGVGVCNDTVDACVVEPDNEGAGCDDADLCTDFDTCTAGMCTGVDRDCSGMADDCNQGVCDPATGSCVASPLPNGTGCEDGEYCTTQDVCSNGTCTGGPSLDCSAISTQCSDGVCNEATNECVAQAVTNGTACDDAAFCTTGDTCQDSLCEGGPAMDCDDSDVCTNDSCDEAQDICDHNIVPNPGAEGPVGDATCSDGIDNDCDTLIDDLDPDCRDCVTDADCDDSNVCTVNTCSGGNCQTANVNDGTTCDDGRYCTTPDVCTGGVCGGADRDCSHLDEGCVTGVCNEGTDACEAQQVADGNPCDDDLYCMDNDVCTAGVCAGTPRDCSGMADDCNVGICNEVSSACEADPLADGTTCSDGMYCTTPDTCTAGQCGGLDRDCSAVENACNDGVCDEATDQCVQDPVEDGTACNDFDDCTEGDACAEGVCGGTAVDADEDGFASDACGGNDCDDTDASVNPDGVEICGDDIDQDCSGADLGCECEDADDDGFMDEACGGDDCDDDDEDINPDADEVCDDEIDNDCDEDVDMDDLDCTCEDADEDGFNDEECGGDDCDDDDAEINPDAAEVCGDDIDQDCNGEDLQCGCEDADQDGYNDQACGGTDCADGDPDINPGETENCSDGIDNDCDGLADEADTSDCDTTASGCDCATPATRAASLIGLLALFGLLLIRRRR